MEKKLTYSFLVILFFSGCSYFSVSQDDIDRITYNYDNDSVTEHDINTMRGFYNTLIFAGRMVYPEASKILKHYLHGDGSDLYIRSGYFFRANFKTPFCNWPIGYIDP